MRLKIASRSSDLARIQAFQVARELKKLEPTLAIDFEFRSSLGDQNLDVPLASWGSKGVFTQDFFEDLKQGKFDLVVHSWKDLPTEAREGTEVVATLARADVRDLLLVPKDVWRDAKEVLTLLSSSPRRAYNLREFEQFLPKKIKIEFANVRGNVPTRIEKMFEQKAGLILAKAALDRLLSAPESDFSETQKKLRARLQQCHFMVLPVGLNPPAAAQGALAIEVKSDRTDLKDLFARLNDQNTFASVEWERSTLKSYGGGCHQKIGVISLPKTTGVWRVLKGVTDQGEILNGNDWMTNQKPLPKALSRAQVFPAEAEDNRWFDRERISKVQPTATALVAAKAEAWPDDFKFDGVVWTSGLISWKKLASKGVWVNGCSEGWGDEEMRLEALAPGLTWQKLTHSASPGKDHLATYQLVPKAPSLSPSLKGKTHFFWMSGSSFKRAYELFPEELQAGYHGCGPGLTNQLLQSHSLKNTLKNPPKVFLTLEAFLNEVLPP